MQLWIVLWSLLLPAPAPSAPTRPEQAGGEVRYRGLEALLATFDAKSGAAIERQKRKAIPMAPMSAD